MPDENLRNVENLIMPPEQREEILNELRLLLKWNTKISKLLGDSTL